MQQHGRYELGVHGRILFVRLFESWNLETARAYMQDMDEAAAGLAGEPWAIVSDLRRWGLSGMELMSPIQEQARRLTQAGRTHSVFLIDHSEGLLTDLMDRAVAAASPGVEVVYRRNEREAAEFLAAAGFDVDSFQAAAVP